MRPAPFHLAASCELRTQRLCHKRAVSEDIASGCERGIVSQQKSSVDDDRGINIKLIGNKYVFMKAVGFEHLNFKWPRIPPAAMHKTCAYALNPHLRNHPFPLTLPEQTQLRFNSIDSLHLQFLPNRVPLPTTLFVLRLHSHLNRSFFSVPDHTHSIL